MTGFEPQTSGAESDRSTNWATTTALRFYIYTCSSMGKGTHVIKCPKQIGGIKSIKPLGGKERYPEQYSVKYRLKLDRLSIE